MRRNGERNCKEELGTLAVFALDLKFSTHKFDKRLRNHKPKPSATILSCNGAVRLRKGMEQYIQLLVRHADASVNNAERKTNIVSDDLFLLYLKYDVSAFCKLGGVVDEICENLRKT